MKNPRRRRIVSILAAVLLLAALGCAYAAYGFMTDERDARAQIRKKLNNLSSSLVHVFQSDAAIHGNYEKILIKKAKLSALPLRHLVQEEGDDAIRAYDQGLVLRVSGNEVVLPEDMPFPSPVALQFRDETGACSTPVGLTCPWGTSPTGHTCAPSSASSTTTTMWTTPSPRCATTTSGPSWTPRACSRTWRTPSSGTYWCFPPRTPGTN